MTYTINQFRALNKPELIVVTQHSRKRFAERGIRLSDVCKAIETGEIVEYYPEDYPVPSCLILGITKEKVLHICASICEGYLYIITAYVPDPAKWEPDWKKRKGEAK